MTFFPHVRGKASSISLVGVNDFLNVGSSAEVSGLLGLLEERGLGDRGDIVAEDDGELAGDEGCFVVAGGGVGGLGGGGGEGRGSDCFFCFFFANACGEDGFDEAVNFFPR